MTAQVDLKKGWTLENEIDWLRFHIAQNERALTYQRKQLAEYLAAEQAWWERFLNYCQTGR